MSLLSDTVAGIRQVLMMSADMERLADDVKDAQQDIRGLNDRLTRIEVLIDITQRRLPSSH